MFPFLVLLSAKFIFNVCDLMVICFFFSFLDPQNKSAASISQRVICFFFWLCFLQLFRWWHLLSANKPKSGEQSYDRVGWTV